jgi:hypothetical protein
MARRESVQMRSTIGANPFERCGVKRPNALGWRTDYFELTLLSVRNLSNIAHTRYCIALNQS